MLLTAIYIILQTSEMRGMYMEKTTTPTACPKQASVYYRVGTQEQLNPEQSEKNRVYALYRVSTLGQVEKDDIPMQKQCCHEFVERQGWNIVREFSEKGVSGFKVSAKDRDAIQEIQKDAALGKFDILLVFMFDRLGRRDDETPFVVEWFAKNGIEVWSVMEGQQRFDSHVDKLMNYIRYWQASGESLKTSIRTKTRLGQITEEGHYTGGSVPYGYRAVDKGRVNKKNRTVLDLEVDADEAAIVQLIFKKYVSEGYGAQRICRFLHDSGITSRDGKGFPNTTLNRIIKNVIYTGILKNGESQSEYLDELRIIDVETYSKAQEIMRQRTRPHSSIPLNSKGKSLVVGNIFCAHCGNRLTLTTSGKRMKRVNGEIYYEPRIRYQCHYNVRHPGECDGQSGYSVTKLDSIVDQVIRMKFSEIKAASESEILAGQHEKEIELARIRFEKAIGILHEKEKDLKDYQKETLKVIRGQSKLSIDLLNTMVTDTETEIKAAQSVVDAAERSYTEQKASAENLRSEYDQLLTWADLYDKSSFEAKKMIVAQFIKAVYVGRDYNIEIEFNVTFEEFQSYCMDAEQAEKKAGVCSQPA
ncbi:MAG: recombinase family protein [Oscillospiraceae bacterium]|nr:recombinase family protein [Oscillospiraceae bacterium]